MRPIHAVEECSVYILLVQEVSKKGVSVDNDDRQIGRILSRREVLALLTTTKTDQGYAATFDIGIDPSAVGTG